MVGSMRKYLLSCCLVLIWAWLSNSSSFAQGLDPRLKKMLNDWQKRHERVKVVRYSVECESVGYKEASVHMSKSLGIKPPDQGSKIKTKMLLILDFIKDRHRLEYDGYEFSGSTGK